MSNGAFFLNRKGRKGMFIFPEPLCLLTSGVFPLSEITVLPTIFFVKIGISSYNKSRKKKWHDT